MRPIYWRPPIELSATEQAIIKRIRRARLFVFLRQHRHEVFDEAFQHCLIVRVQCYQRVVDYFGPLGTLTSSWCVGVWACGREAMRGLAG